MGDLALSLLHPHLVGFEPSVGLAITSLTLRFASDDMRVSFVLDFFHYVQNRVGYLSHRSNEDAQ